MERWKRIENEKQVELDGIAVAITKTDGRVTELVLEDSSGHRVKMRHGDTYGSLQAFAPAPPPMVTKWRVGGRLNDVVDINEIFDEHNAALERERELKQASASEHSSFRVEAIEVPEDANTKGA